LASSRNLALLNIADAIFLIGSQVQCFLLGQSKNICIYIYKHIYIYIFDDDTIKKLTLDELKLDKAQKYITMK